MSHEQFALPFLDTTSLAGGLGLYGGFSAPKASPPAAIDLEPEADEAPAAADPALDYRFAGDRHCTGQRFAAYAEALGERFVGRVLPDSAANPRTPPFFEHVVASPHSVVTAHLIDEAGQPTIAARDEIIAFFASRLVPAGRRARGLL